MVKSRDEREAEIAAQEDGAAGTADDFDRRRRRLRFIDRLIVRERRRRGLVNFDELASCALSAQMTRGEAYAVLIEDIRLGEFQAKGRDRVLYLSADMTFRMSPRGVSLGLLTNVIATEDANAQRLHFSRCWTTHALARRWCERHGFPWPSHLGPEEAQIQAPGPMQQRGRDPAAARAAQPTSPVTGRRLGRPPGSVSYATDNALVREGAEMVKSGAVPSPTKAAEKLAPRAEGTDISSKERRLRDKIKAELEAMALRQISGATKN